MHKKTNSRREFLKTTGKAGLVAGLSMTAIPSLARITGETGSPAAGIAEDIPYEQTPLPYAYNSLDTVIDALTMEIHYSKHAAAYAKNLADAVKAENVDTNNLKLVNLLGKVSSYSPKMRNNGGGQYNHEFFWKSLQAPGGSTQPGGELGAAISSSFGSFDAFKNQFADAGKNRFGSGWAWLALNGDKKLVIGSTPNQDNPLMDVSDFKGIPLLGLDVWEHAYYLKYQNRRPDYINAWWNVVNWAQVEKRWKAAM